MVFGVIEDVALGECSVVVLWKGRQSRQALVVESSFCIAIVMVVGIETDNRSVASGVSCAALAWIPTTNR